MSSPFRRTLPPHPDLDQQKTQAKELLQQFAAGDAASVARVRDVLPDKPQIKLADAQFVIAREYGFSNWAALKQEIEARTADTRSPELRMHEAFSRCDAKAVRKLFAEAPQLRARINEPLFSFDSPAIVAFAGDAEMVDVLLDAGADPNARSSWWAGGFHALYSATGAAAARLLAGGATPDACALAHLDRADLLREMLAADPERVHERGGDGQTPLHFARSTEVADLLLDAGADIDARDLDHRATAAEWMLDRARGAGRYDLARHLVSRGASADIFLATALGLAERVSELVAVDPGVLALRTGEGAYGEQPPSSYHIYFWTIGGNRSPLDVALQFEHPELLEIMRPFATSLQRLLFACRGGDAAEARAIVRAEPGLVASLSPADQRALTDAAWNGEARAVELMLELGFSPTAPGQDGGTALHCAAWYGSPETVAVLLAHPGSAALLEIREPVHHATPLGWCGHASRHGNTSRDHAGVARLLLAAGARVPDGFEASRAVMREVRVRGG